MHEPCTCAAMHSHDYPSVRGHCLQYFRPDGWEYSEGPPPVRRPALFLTGHCFLCGGSIDVGMPVPSACTEQGDRYHFLYHQLRTWRPYAIIAFNAMRTELFNHFRAQRAAMRCATVLEYDEDHHTASLEDSVSMQVERAEELAQTRRKLSRCLSPSQSKIIHLKVLGYSVREAAKAHGVQPKEVTAELEAARDNIVRFAPELMERAA